MRSIPRATLRPYICPSCRHGIVCVGGGPAGLGLLAALRALPVTSKLKVALVESQDLGKARGWNLDSSRFSNRVSSLTLSSVTFLQKIGA
ncbi:ubiquinone biosynthesis monooxgenase [Penicillium sp. IBT 16267x]|nr:ubiquinone biosynthesis monooxgenase [Penicillium sp. IBT 16267x]